ncbi:MAG: SPOR domain-containing protein [Marinilabiliaceae bacterium]
MKISSLMPVAFVALAVLFGGCSRKGSSSISSGHKSSTSRVAPKVRAQQDAEAARQASLKAAQDAEAEAKAAAEQAAKAAQEAKEAAEAEAKAAAEQAAKAAQEAKAAAEAKAKAAAEQAVVVKEEKVKIIETKAETDESHKYHIIIGSFKQLTNARQQCQDAIAKGFLPSIMENEEGLYRVSVCSYISEAAARTKISELRKKHKEYVGMWLLIEKK